MRWSLAVVPSPTWEMLFWVDYVIMVDCSFEASLSAAREVAFRDWALMVVGRSPNTIFFCLWVVFMCSRVA